MELYQTASRALVCAVRYMDCLTRLGTTASVASALSLHPTPTIAQRWPAHMADSLAKTSEAAQALTAELGGLSHKLGRHKHPASPASLTPPETLLIDTSEMRADQAKAAYLKTKWENPPVAGSDEETLLAENVCARLKSIAEKYAKPATHKMANLIAGHTAWLTKLLNEQETLMRLERTATERELSRLFHVAEPASETPTELLTV